MKATTLIIAAVSLATTALAHQAVSGQNDDAALAATTKEVATEVETAADSSKDPSSSQVISQAKLSNPTTATKADTAMEDFSKPSKSTVPEPGPAALGIIGMSIILLKRRK